MTKKHFFAPSIVVLYAVLFVASLFFFSGSSIGPTGHITLVESVPQQTFLNLIMVVIIFGVIMGILLEVVHKKN